MVCCAESFTLWRLTVRKQSCCEEAHFSRAVCDWRLLGSFHYTYRQLRAMYFHRKALILLVVAIHSIWKRRWCLSSLFPRRTTSTNIVILHSWGVFFVENTRHRWFFLGGKDDCGNAAGIEVRDPKRKMDVPPWVHRTTIGGTFRRHAHSNSNVPA